MEFRKLRDSFDKLKALVPSSIEGVSGGRNDLLWLMKREMMLNQGERYDVLVTEATFYIDQINAINNSTQCIQIIVANLTQTYEAEIGRAQKGERAMPLDQFQEQALAIKNMCDLLLATSGSLVFKPLVEYEIEMFRKDVLRTLEKITEHNRPYLQQPE